MSSNEVSDREIEREIQTLRNLRRRSVTSSGPGALPLDPDLPPPSPNKGATENDVYPQYSSNDDVTLSSNDGLDGEGLFWVPAHLHPELAPGEFRAFLKSHTHTDPTHADAEDAGDAPGMSRNPSWVSRSPSRRGSESLGRKKSMLCRQYQPKAGDGVEEDRPPVPMRQSGSIYGGRSGEKGLTLQDLQKLEELVDEAGEDDDPESMRRLLRRSLSMNVAPGFLQDDVAQGEDTDAPLVAPRPGSILRRSARTKIRKAGMTGDGGGHRFAATRKGRMTAAPQREIPGLEDDDYVSFSRGSDEASGESDDKFHEAYEGHRGSGDTYQYRRNSDASTDEANIFDAYTQEPHSNSSSSHDHSASPSPEPSPPNKNISLPTFASSGSYADSQDWFSDNDHTPTQESSNIPVSQRENHHQSMANTTSGVGGLTLDTRLPRQPEASPAPSPRSTFNQIPTDSHELLPGMAPPAQGLPSPNQYDQGMTPVIFEKPQLQRTETSTSVSSTGTSAKEKEKKGKFFSKKKEKDEKEKKGKKEKERFLGSLFGGKKKVEETSSVSNFSSAGPAAAAALLGTSKSAKSVGVPPSSSPTSPGFQHHGRYPIHVERAVYRLSHIKLANARRPLYEQVLISNLMFWYLGVLGRNVTEEKKANADEKKEEVKPVVKGTPPKPADTGSAGTPIPPPPITRTPHIVTHPEPLVVNSSPAPAPAPTQPAQSKKTSLSKPERARDGRNNEAPVRSPQYGMQTAQVDQDVRNAQNQLKPQPKGPARSHSPHPPQQQVSPGGYAAHQQHPPPALQQQMQRSTTPNGPASPARTMSPPSPGANGPRSPEIYGKHREVLSPSRGEPQSSFGPPPPSVQGAGVPGLEPRQRTMSNPTTSHPGAPIPPPGGSPARRVVTEGRSSEGGMARSHVPQQSGPQYGPQPGQLFQYPGGPYPSRPAAASPVSSGSQPGHIYNHPQQRHPSATGQPQPGQVFHHPQAIRPPNMQQHPNQGHPQYGQRPLPPAGHQQQQQHPHGWEPPQRLPPGAGAPQRAGVRPPVQGQGVPGQPFDPRSAQGHPQQVQSQGFYGSPGPSPGMQGRPPVAVQPGQYVYQGEYGHHR